MSRRGGSTEALRPWQTIDGFVAALGTATVAGDILAAVLQHLVGVLEATEARVHIDDGSEYRGWVIDRHGTLQESAEGLCGCLSNLDATTESPLAVDLCGCGEDGTALITSSTHDDETLVVTAIRHGRRRFDERERAQFSSVASLADAALRNMRLVNHLQHKASALEHLATHDPLTGLANRVHFQAVAAEALQRGVAVGVLIVDLDRFKEVNDTLGHHVGDELLREVASRLRSSIARSGLIARLGGDEFAVLLLGHSDAPLARAQQLHHDLERSARVDELEVDVGASIGLATVEPDAEIGLLLRRADVAMYAAKAARSGVEVFRSGLDHYRPESLTLVPRFRSAIERGELGVAFQPQFQLTSGTIVGAEALVRWSLPGIGPVPPSDFIPIAESTGLIRPLTRHVLFEAVEQCARWHASGHNVRVSVNISPRVLLDPGMADQVTNLIELVGLPPRLLRLEVTETSVMVDPDRAIEVLRELLDRGLSIAIDDFGTGQSSLAYLASLPCNELKIDRSFIIALESDPRAEAVVRSIIRLGADLGLDIVAEGVETSQAARQLRHLRCPHVQGFLFGRPMRAAAFERFLGEHQGAKARVPG